MERRLVSVVHRTSIPGSSAFICFIFKSSTSLSRSRVSNWHRRLVNSVHRSSIPSWLGMLFPHVLLPKPPTGTAALFPLSTALASPADSTTSDCSRCSCSSCLPEINFLHGCPNPPCSSRMSSTASPSCLHSLAPHPPTRIVFLHHLSTSSASALLNITSSASRRPHFDRGSPKIIFSRVHR